MWWGKCCTIHHGKQRGLLLPCQKDKGKNIGGFDVTAKRGAKFKGETVNISRSISRFEVSSGCLRAYTCCVWNQRHTVKMTDVRQNKGLNETQAAVQCGNMFEEP